MAERLAASQEALSFVQLIRYWIFVGQLVVKISSHESREFTSTFTSTLA
jgi:hypothetical protein